jgi:hypothetical protein
MARESGRIWFEREIRKDLPLSIVNSGRFHSTDGELQTVPIYNSSIDVRHE